ncbi:lysophospholipid acyltransferase family protein [Egicoccus halophilus]|uniref:Phospholipid/glycerol acyltransferase domain-containing protein n=1 Tax=Egicoccus halophilus TaxID=1670830 RepID=A0A8J3AEG0_9ACTN|nr:lysophospholipid acyltransferase family protein [Egicoccus halophilus]GGI05649.1 hypothetical protein GCM10011354_15140 [Egicoccus halophilus]
MNAASRDADVISIAEQRAARSRATGVARERCAATTADGRPCRNYAVDQGRCRVHAPRPAATTDADPGVDPGVDPGADPGVDPGADPGASDDAGHATSSGARARIRRADDEAARAAARVAREAQKRGWQPPVDALGALHEVAGASWTDHLREGAAFLRRRLTGDYEVDEFGFDEDLTNSVLMPLVRPLHRHWWRVASHGAANVPSSGGGLVVANHAGTLPADALITRLDILEQTGRHARELAADLALRTPFVGPFARKTGATLASGPDADRLLERGELVAVWPEGFKGVGKPWRDRYRLQRFGRGGFVATALRAQVPIVPTAIVGSEEIYPLLYDLRVVARLFGLPYFPIVPQLFALPVLGPLALLPLPSKWVIEYGEPIDTSAYGPEAADDPMVVFELTDHVRDTIQRMLHRNLMGRRSVFL